MNGGEGRMDGRRRRRWRHSYRRAEGGRGTRRFVSFFSLLSRGASVIWIQSCRIQPLNPFPPPPPSQYSTMADYDDLSELETLNDEIATLKSVLEAVKKAETSPDDACDTIASYVVKNGAKDSFLVADPGSEVNNIYHSNVKGSGRDGGGGCCTAS
jgi:hypothetical protein